MASSTSLVNPSLTCESNQDISSSSTPRWRLATRIGFRFSFVYLTLFSLATQVLWGLINPPNIEIPDLETLLPLRPLIIFVATHLFHVTQPLVFAVTGSGDRTSDWVMCFCFLAMAAIVTLAWSFADRKRLNYIVLHTWFRLFLRFALAGQMLAYGFVKLFPIQMPFPTLIKLLEPYGNFSPMGALWYSIGAAPVYEMLCGCAELLASILLFIPRTTTLGALVTVGVTSEIFLLNMTYDVPVKQLSLHLLLMALFLAVPEVPRLMDFFVLRRPVSASTEPMLFHRPRANRIALWVQFIFVFLLIASNLDTCLTQWKVYGGGRPLSPLYGIWKVDKLYIDGHERSPLLNDYGRWRRILFDSPDVLTYQRMDDSFGSFGCKIDQSKQTIVLTNNRDKNWKGSLHYERSSSESLTLDGQMDGHATRMQLVLFDRNKLLLISRGFHWIQESPYNR